MLAVGPEAWIGSIETKSLVCRILSWPPRLGGPLAAWAPAAGLAAAAGFVAAAAAGAVVAAGAGAAAAAGVAVGGAATGVGGCTPTPRKESPASVRIDEAISRVAWTMIGAVTFGQMWRNTIRAGLMPSTRAADTKSRSRTESVWPRVSRAMPGVATMPIAI